MYMLLFTQHLAFTAKCIRKCGMDKQNLNGILFVTGTE